MGSSTLYTCSLSYIFVGDTNRLLELLVGLLYRKGALTSVPLNIGTGASSAMILILWYYCAPTGVR